MAFKRTHIKISGAWENVVTIWRKVSGAWQQDVMSWIKVSGTWKDCMVYDSVSTFPIQLSYDQSRAKYVAVTSSGSWTAAVSFDPNGIISSVTPSGTTGERCYITVDSHKSFASAAIRVTCGTAYAEVSILLSQ